MKGILLVLSTCAKLQFDWIKLCSVSGKKKWLYDGSRATRPASKMGHHSARRVQLQ